MACLSAANVEVLARQPRSRLSRTFGCKSLATQPCAARGEDSAGLQQFRAKMDERIRSIQSEKAPTDFEAFQARIEERIRSMAADPAALASKRSASPLSAATTASPSSSSSSSEASTELPTPEPERQELMCAIDDFTSMPEGLFDELLESGARARTRNQHMQVSGGKRGRRPELVQFDQCAFA